MSSKERNVPSAVPPQLFCYEVPGGLLSLEGKRKADNESRLPKAEYERGSYKDRAGNRGR